MYRSFALLFALCMSGFVHSDVIEGTVTLRNGRPAGSAVVILNGTAKAAAMEPAIVDQRGRKFIPHVSVVTVGTRVDFPNHDTVFHNVFTEFNSTTFDLGMYPRNSTKSQTFHKTGLAVLLCSVHPDMSAYVMVVSTPYYAIADSSGHFKIAGVPAGNYGIEVWHESGQKLSRKGDVRAGSPLNLNLGK